MTGGLVPIPGGLLPSPVGITVPSGVSTVSAAPVRKIPNPSDHYEPPSEPSRPPPKGPPVTIFVGKISEKAPDSLVRTMLSKCGYINLWKRVEGADGKLQTFGYCEFGDPESASTALRILNQYDLLGSPLHVKADTKANKILEDYLKNKKNDEKEEETQKRDDELKKQIDKLAMDMGNTRSMIRTADPNNDLDDMELEEEKRVIINREIDKFRDTYKEDDLDKEKESKRDNKSRQPDQPSLRDRNRRRDNTRDQRRDQRPQERRNDSREGSLDDEEIERRKTERQLKEKELSYQKRLRSWEQREERKDRELREYIRRERETKELEMREVKKLKVFLEDYDDDKDDAKYYRYEGLKERMRDRRREIERDDADRKLEKKELDQLKRKLEDEGHPDPEAEIEKRLNCVTNNATSPPQNGTKRSAMDDRIKELVGEESNDSTPREELHLNPFSLQHKKNSSESQSEANDSKRKPVAHVFDANEEEEGSSQRKRKLPSLEDEDSNSQDKRRQIKELINQIPTVKEELFAVDIDWSFVDNALMEKRVRPWINKKIMEFIGEEEGALVDFICQKLTTKCSAETILSEVFQILDEEAEVFVVKLWRLLIFETQARQKGISK